jgi:hypothetical protein
LLVAEPDNLKNQMCPKPWSICAELEYCSRHRKDFEVNSRLPSGLRGGPRPLQHASSVSHIWYTT